jgi:hypothetical protein
MAPGLQLSGTHFSNVIEWRRLGDIDVQLYVHRAATVRARPSRTVNPSWRPWISAQIPSAYERFPPYRGSTDRVSPGV